MQHFIKRSRIIAPADRVFDWHRAPDAFARLTPPWERVELVERTGGIEEIGSRMVIKMGVRPFRLTWLAEHTHYEPGRMFRDVQLKGPFARWEHTHLVESDGPEACWLEDRIEYELPLAPLSSLVVGWLVRRRLRRVFDFRHQVTARETAGDDQENCPR